MSEDKTMINLTCEVRDMLDSMKQRKSVNCRGGGKETYDEVIRRLLSHWKETLAEQTSAGC